MLRIAIVGGSPLLAAGLASALAGTEGWQVDLRHADDPELAGADVAVLHARDAAEALALLAALPAAMPVVLLGAELHELAARGARQPRALALLAGAATPKQLRAALAAVLEGLSVREPASPWGRGDMGERSPADHEPLTPRELEVFELLGKGLSNRDIAGVLEISAHTAKYHVGQILAKIGAATRAEAVGVGLKLGLIGL